MNATAPDGQLVPPGAMVHMQGMSLRDYFAAHAPQMPAALREMAKRAEKADGRDTSDFGAAAKYESMWRWAYADAMLAGRAR